LAGEKLLKSVLDIQNALRPYTEAMEAASRVVSPLTDTLRMIEENSGIRQMLESIKHDEAVMRAAVGPLEELRRAGVFDVDSLWRRDLGLVQQAMADFDTRAFVCLR
jgi:hypothetical protein